MGRHLERAGLGRWQAYFIMPSDVHVKIVRWDDSILQAWPTLNLTPKVVSWSAGGDQCPGRSKATRHLCEHDLFQGREVA